MTDVFKEMLWAYRAVFTQTAGGGGNVKVTITMNERTQILYALLGADDYAADRNLNVRIHDSSGNIVGIMMFPTPTDNEIMAFPDSQASALISGAGNEFNLIPVIGMGEAIIITGFSLAQNETLTVAIRALISSIVPTIVTTGSTGIVTTTTTYSKVI